jgi:hypothetical protein
MRAPVVVFGLLALVTLPLLVRRVLDRTTATLFACLLAISPLHIYYSRYARPYAVSLFCAACGIYAFYLWWTTRSRLWKYLYVACAIVGPYFHLTVLPVLFAPLALIAVQAFWGRTPDPEFSSAKVLRLILVTAGGLALLLLPPIWADFASLAEKAQHGSLTGESLMGALGLLIGMEAPAAQALTLAVMALGAVTLLHEQPRLALLLGTTAAVVLLGIAAARPTEIEYPIVLARYALFLLPVMILALAIGLRRIGGWLRSVRPAAVVCWAAWLIVTAKLGPLGRTYYAPNGFTNHAAFQYYPYFDDPRNAYMRHLSRPVSAFYTEMGRLPASSLRLLEAPWYYEWHYNPYPFYQRVHRQRVAIGFVKSEPFPSGELPPFDRRFRFSNFVHLQDRRDICAHGIDRVVLHKDLQRELGKPANRDFSEDMARWIPEYRRDYGPAVFEDETLVVFDMTASCHGNPRRE